MVKIGPTRDGGLKGWKNISANYEPNYAKFRSEIGLCQFFEIALSVFAILDMMRDKHDIIDPFAGNGVIHA